MAGYTRQSIANIVNGSNITAPPLNAEFNQLAAAFDSASGHSHDGSTGSSPKIDLTTSISGYLPAIHGGIGGKNNTTATSNPTTSDDFNDGYAPGSIWLNSTNGRVFFCVTNTSSNAVWAEALAITPNNRITAEVSNTVDIGSSVYQFKDIYIDGTGYIDAISGDTVTLTSNASVGGNLTLTGNYVGSGNLTNTGTGYFGGNVTTNSDLAVTGTLNAAGDVNFGNATSDTVTFISRVDSSIIPSADATYNLGSTTQEWQNLYIDGIAEIDQLNADSVDIDAGNIDNTVIGAGTPVSGSFNGLTSTGTVNFGSATVSNLGSVTTADINGGSIDGVTIGTNSAVTDLRVDNLKLDGNAVVSTNTNGNIDLTPNGTGEVNISKVDIDSGTIDNTVIGSATPAAATFTTVTTTGQATLASADINGGTIDGTSIGSNSPSSGAFTTVSASGGFTGDITGNITGNTSGTHTGAVVGNVTGDLTGNLTASSGSSTFNNVTINGTLDVTSTVISNVSDPVANADAANKGYVDTAISDLIGGAPGALDTLNELADALNDDANAYATLDAKINTKLTKAGDTMSGVLAMGSNKITGVSDPTANQDASTKAYTDTQRDTRVAKTGDTMSGVLNMGSNKVTNLTDPTSAQDAATKNYIDTIFGTTSAAATSAANAATSETNAANSATAASGSQTNAAASALAAANSYDDFDDRYLGPKATAPTVDNDGDALVLGSLYFNTASDTMQVYGSSGWVPAGSSVNGTSERFKYTSTAAQTTFSGADDNSNSLSYDSGFLDVYLSGVRLVNGTDFTATSGTSIQLTTGASVGDILEVVTFGTFTLSNQSIDDMTDVSISSLSSGQVLKYNGTAWVNGTDESEVVNDTTPQLGGNLDVNGNDITSSGNLTIDVSGEIELDSGNGDVEFKKNGVSHGFISNNSDSLQIYAPVSNKDILFKGNDNGNVVTALTLDMSDAGTALFGNHVRVIDNSSLSFGASNDLSIHHSSSDNNSYITETGSGSLVIAADQLYIQNAAKTETKAIFTTDGSVSLRHNDVTRFNTSTTGATIEGRIRSIGSDGGYSGSLNLNNGATNGQDWTIASTSDQYSIGNNKLIFNTGSAGNSGTTKMFLTDGGTLALNTTSNVASTMAAKLLIGAPLDATSSAIAQINGFIRLGNSIIFHNPNDDAQEITLGYSDDLGALRPLASSGGGNKAIAADLLRATALGSGSAGASIDLVPVDGSNNTSPFIRFYDFAGNGGGGAAVDDANWAVGVDDTSVSSFKIVYGGGSASNKITSIHGASAALAIDSDEITTLALKCTDVSEASGATSIGGSTVTTLTNATRSRGSYLVHAWIRYKGTAPGTDPDPVNIRLKKGSATISTSKILKSDSQIAGTDGNSTGLDDFASFTSMIHVNGSTSMTIDVYGDDPDAGGADVDWNYFITQVGG